MLPVKRIALVGFVCAVISVSGSAEDATRTVEAGRALRFTDADVSGAVNADPEAPHQLPELPDERQPVKRYTQEARRTLWKALDAFKAFAETVGRASEKGFHAAKESVTKGLSVAKKHTRKGYIEARRATSEGLQKLGKRLELPSQSSTTTPYPEAAKRSAPSSGEAPLESTPSEAEGKDTDESATVSTDPSFTSSAPADGFDEPDFRRGEPSDDANEELQV